MHEDYLLSAIGLLSGVMNEGLCGAADDFYNILAVSKSKESLAKGGAA